MFFLKLPSLMPGLQNLCRACKWVWFLCVMWPVLVISNAVTDVCKCEISVRKCAYLLVLYSCCLSMFVISGHVSSKMWNFSLVFPHIISPYSPSPVWSLMIQNRDTQNSCFNTSLESYGSDLSDRPAPTQQIWTCWSSEFFHIMYTEECNILDMKDR